MNTLKLLLAMLGVSYIGAQGDMGVDGLQASEYVSDSAATACSCEGAGSCDVCVRSAEQGVGLAESLQQQASDFSNDIAASASQEENDLSDDLAPTSQQASDFNSNIPAPVYLQNDLSDDLAPTSQQASDFNSDIPAPAFE